MDMQLPYFGETNNKDRLNTNVALNNGSTANQCAYVGMVVLAIKLILNVPVFKATSINC